MLTHLFTGHSYLRYFQHNIGNEPSSLCRNCDDSPTSMLRMKFWGSLSLSFLYQMVAKFSKALI